MLNARYSPEKSCLEHFVSLSSMIRRNSPAIRIDGDFARDRGLNAYSTGVHDMRLLDASSVLRKRLDRSSVIGVSNEQIRCSDLHTAHNGGRVAGMMSHLLSVRVTWPRLWAHLIFLALQRSQALGVLGLALEPSADGPRLALPFSFSAVVINDVGC